VVRTSNQTPITNNAATALVLAGNRPSDQVAFESAVVDFFVDAADLLGVPKSVAAIYGIVFATAEPLSFADIAARLDISKGSVSQGLRVLREVGALIEAPNSQPQTPSARLLRDGSQHEAQSSRPIVRYAPDLALRKLIARFLENRLQKQLEAGKGKLTALKRAFPASRNGDVKLLRDRIAALDNWNAKARALLPVARTFLRLTPI
jgi:DNA-binding transcriptional ArsR family regulator